MLSLAMEIVFSSRVNSKVDVRLHKGAHRDLSGIVMLSAAAAAAFESSLTNQCHSTGLQSNTNQCELSPITAPLPGLSVLR